MLHTTETRHDKETHDTIAAHQWHLFSRTFRSWQYNRIRDPMRITATFSSISEIKLRLETRLRLNNNTADNIWQNTNTFLYVRHNKYTSWINNTRLSISGAPYLSVIHVISGYASLILVIKGKQGSCIDALFESALRRWCGVF